MNKNGAIPSIVMLEEIEQKITKLEEPDIVAKLRKVERLIPDSMFNVDGAWNGVRKKVKRSANVWG